MRVTPTALARFSNEVVYMDDGLNAVIHIILTAGYVIMLIKCFEYIERMNLNEDAEGIYQQIRAIELGYTKL